MSSKVDQITADQKLQLLNELYGLGADVVWQADAIVEWFGKIGVDCKLHEDGKAVIFLGERIEPCRGKWGDPGITGPALLSVLIKEVGITIHSYGFNGRGFIYRDHLTQLAQLWGLGDRYTHK